MTTFADVPWNAPYYVRCGFRVLEDGEVTAGLRAIRQHEASFGMDRWPRVCMPRLVTSAAASPHPAPRTPIPEGVPLRLESHDPDREQPVTDCKDFECHG